MPLIYRVIETPIPWLKKYIGCKGVLVETLKRTNGCPKGFVLQFPDGYSDAFLIKEIQLIGCVKEKQIK